jgi:pimeloyl-ACP methyl ester carboxylesterase
MSVFDYGAPTGLRMAIEHPERVTAIVLQNGNAYEEGLGDAWAPIQRYWRQPTLEHRNAIRAGLNLEGLRHEYSVGIPDPAVLKPEGYTLDAALLARPGNVDIQLDLFFDYANNVKLYPKLQEYFRSAQPPLLAVWDKFDLYFTRPLFHSSRRQSLPARHPERDGSIPGDGVFRARNAPRRGRFGDAGISSAGDQRRFVKSRSQDVESNTRS